MNCYFCKQPLPITGLDTNVCNRHLFNINTNNYIRIFHFINGSVDYFIYINGQDYKFLFNKNKLIISKYSSKIIIAEFDLDKISVTPETSVKLLQRLLNNKTFI